MTLLKKGRWEEALKELKWLRGPHVSVTDELEETSRVVEKLQELAQRTDFTKLGK